MITPENIVRHELIGLTVKIVGGSNPKNTGITGRVVDETRNMLTIEKPDGKEAKLAKEDNTFSFHVGSAWIRVDGKLLVGRPEDRIKKKFRKW
jgi:ribonuclease P protein subunit POP4